MNSTIKDILAKLFVIALILFFLRTNIYWINLTNGNMYSYDKLLFYANMFLLFVSIISAMQFSITKNLILGLLVLWVMDLLLIITRTSISVADIPKAITWPVLFITTFAFVSNRKTTIIWLRRGLIVCALIGLIFFLSKQIQEHFMSQSNLVYFALLPFPFIMLNMKRKNQIRVLIITTMLAIMSLKRSMLLVFALTWLLLFLFNFFIQKKTIKGIAVFVAIVFVAYYGFNYIDEVSRGAYTERFSLEDVSNGREDIYDVTWFMIYQSEPSDLWLGHGYNSTAKHSIMDRAAHNDFLETLYDYGIVGAVLLVLFWLYIIVKWMSLFFRNSNYIVSYTLSLSILAVMSMVSVLILYNSYFNYLILYWATIEVLEPGISFKRTMRQKRLLKNDVRYSFD